VKEVWWHKARCRKKKCGIKVIGHPIKTQDTGACGMMYSIQYSAVQVPVEGPL
jgi:hypothetical protein